MPAAPSSARAHWRVRITWTIGILFTGLNLLAIGAVLAIGLHGAGENTEALILERLEDAIETAADGMDLIVDPMEAQAAEIADAVRTGRVDPDDRATLRTYLSGMLAMTPHLLGIAIADAQLRFEAFVRHDRAGVVEGLPGVATVASLVDWARGAAAPRWVHGWSPMLRQPIVMLQTRLDRGDRFYGVVLNVLALAELAQRIGLVAREVGHPVYVLYGRDQVIAHSAASATFAPTPQHPIATIAEIGDPILARIWDEAGESLPPDELIAHVFGRRIATPEGPATFIYRPLGGDANGYVVGTYYRGSLAAAEVARLRDMAIAGAVVLALSVLLTIVFGRKVSRPIRALAGAAAVVERQRFDEFRPLGPSMIREVDEAGRAFNQMVEGLKERQRIRDLFGKYVPHEVVEQLIARPESFGLGGERREISLLFTDIAGFTGLAESMPPSEVLRLLTAYFEAVCACIHAEDGIVADFIGDAVFAIFGAPIARPDHARRALACARAMDRVANAFAAARNAEGVAFGATRIGVHTGIATVGNFGSSDRLKYSAAGDVVNATSRLEGANKFFGTRLLASRALVDAGGDRDWRPLGRLVLKGRRAELAVVECLAPATAAQDWVERYRRAYALVEAGSPDAAAALRALATERPDDPVIRFHLARAAAGVPSATVELAEK